VDRYDVRVPSESRGQDRLARESLRHAWVASEARGKQLDGDVSLERFVVRQNDFGSRTASEDSDRPVPRRKRRVHRGSLSAASE
jgi:hypothetical protein